jgi:hypothetical protein
MKKLNILSPITTQTLFAVSDLPLGQGADSFWVLTDQGYLYNIAGTHANDFNTAQQLIDALNNIQNKSKIFWSPYTDPATGIAYLSAQMKKGEKAIELNLYSSDQPTVSILAGIITGGSQVSLQYAPNFALYNHRSLHGHLFTLNGNPITPDGLYEIPYNTYFQGYYPYRISFNFSNIAF